MSLMGNPMSNQSNFNNEVARHIPIFIAKCYTLKIKSLFPELAEAQSARLSQIMTVNTAVSTKLPDTKLMDLLHSNGVPATAAVDLFKEMERNVLDAIVGLGSDIMEDSSIHKVVWTC